MAASNVARQTFSLVIVINRASPTVIKLFNKKVKGQGEVEEKRNESLSSKFNVNLTENAKPKGVQSRRLGATQLKCVLGSYFTHQDKALHVMRNFRAVVL